MIVETISVTHISDSITRLQTPPFNVIRDRRALVFSESYSFIKRFIKYFSNISGKIGDTRLLHESIQSLTVNVLLCSHHMFQNCKGKANVGHQMTVNTFLGLYVNIHLEKYELQDV